MTEKDYLLLLKRHVQLKRVVCGFNEDAYGKAIVTTGVPKEYKEGVTTYINRKTMCDEDYIMSSHSKRR